MVLTILILTAAAAAAAARPQTTKKAFLATCKTLYAIYAANARYRCSKRLSAIETEHLKHKQILLDDLHGITTPAKMKIWQEKNTEVEKVFNERVRIAIR